VLGHIRVELSGNSIKKIKAHDMKKDYIVVNRDRIIMATCSSREVATEYAMEYREMFNLNRPNDVRVLVSYTE
jgi:hypothetical protein